MRANNSSKKSFLMGMVGIVLAMTAAAFGSKKNGNDRPLIANGLAGASGNPMFITGRHPIQSYRSQQREAKKRRRARQ